MSRTSIFIPRAGPAVTLGAFALVLAPGVVFGAAALSPAGAVLAGGVFAGGAGLALRGMARGYPHDRPGGCNLVTMVRMALASGLAAALLPQGGGGAVTGWTLFGVAMAALALDGVDGYLARRQRLASDFGARFDMEVDALLGAVLALIALTQGRAGPELLLLGFLRYGFLAATLVLPRLGAPLFESRRRKVVCVIQIGTLAVLLLPNLPDLVARGLALTAAALLVWSFAADIRWLARRG